MNSDKVNRWLTLGANLGVVLGLAFLIVEIRQNTTALTAQAYQARSDALVELSRMIAESEVLATIEANLTIRPETCSEFERHCEVVNDEYFASLGTAERQQYKRLLMAQLFRIQNLVFQYEQGLLSDEYHDRNIIRTIRTYIPLWEKFDIYQRDSLVEHLEKYENR